MAQSSRPSLVSIASAYVSDESNVVCVLHACTYAQACVHDLCTVIEGWEAWILHTSGANRRRIINALTRTSLKQTLFLVIGVGLTLLHWIRLVFGNFFFLLFFFSLWTIEFWKVFDTWNCQKTLCFLLFDLLFLIVDIGLIEVCVELIRCRLFSFFFLLGIILVLGILEMKILFGIWKVGVNFKFGEIWKHCWEEWIDEIFFFFRVSIFEIYEFISNRYWLHCKSSNKDILL